MASLLQEKQRELPNDAYLLTRASTEVQKTIKEEDCINGGRLCLYVD